MKWDVTNEFKGKGYKCSNAKAKNMFKDIESICYNSKAKGYTTQVQRH